MVKRVLAWIRHGEYAQPPGVPSAHLPHGLTPRGQEQARAAALAVWQYADQQGLAIDRVIDSSRLRRAWETARLMARELQRLGSPPLVDERSGRETSGRETSGRETSGRGEFSVQEFDELAERSLGAAANLTVGQIEAVLAADPRFEVPAPGWKRDRCYVLPLTGAESLEQAGRRVARHVMTRMRAQSGAASLKLFVGHGGAFRHAACELGLLSPEDVQRLTMQHGTPIYLEHVYPEHVVHPTQHLQRRGDDVTGDRLVHAGGEWRPRSAAAAVD
jgi:2,3-bisphosphoglycerate-dependent phosphoglycerate mutase